MNKTQLSLYLTVIVLMAFLAGFCAGMIVAGNSNWECWGQETTQC